MYSTNHKNILLVGKTGAGKSTIANILLGSTSQFKESNRYESQTKQCQIGRNNLFGNRSKPVVQVIDTPGFMDSSGDDSNTIFNIFDMLTSIKDQGLHLILFCLSATEMRCDKGILDALKSIQTLMSSQVMTHIYVIVTQINKLQRECIDAQCQKIKNEVPQILMSANLKINFQPIFFYYHGNKNNGLDNLESLLVQQQTFIPDVVKDLRQCYDPNNKEKSLQNLAYKNKQIQKLIQELENQRQMKEMMKEQQIQQERFMYQTLNMQQQQTRDLLNQMEKKFQQERRQMELNQQQLLKQMEKDQAFSQQQAKLNLKRMQQNREAIKSLIDNPPFWGRDEHWKAVKQLIDNNMPY